MFTTRVSLRNTTMFTYSHENTPLGQSERAYYLSYLITLTLIVSYLCTNSETFSREFPFCFSICKSKVGRKNLRLEVRTDAQPFSLLGLTPLDWNKPFGPWGV